MIPIGVAVDGLEGFFGGDERAQRRFLIWMVAFIVVAVVIPYVSKQLR